MKNFTSKRPGNYAKVACFAVLFLLIGSFLFPRPYIPRQWVIGRKPGPPIQAITSLLLPRARVCIPLALPLQPVRSWPAC